MGVGLEYGGWILCCQVHCGRREEAEWMGALETGRPVRNPLQQTRGAGGGVVRMERKLSRAQATGF